MEVSQSGLMLGQLFPALSNYPVTPFAIETSRHRLSLPARGILGIPGQERIGIGVLSWTPRLQGQIDFYHYSTRLFRDARSRIVYYSVGNFPAARSKGNMSVSVTGPWGP